MFSAEAEAAALARVQDQSKKNNVAKSDRAQTPNNTSALDTKHQPPLTPDAGTVDDLMPLC